MSEKNHRLEEGSYHGSPSPQHRPRRTNNKGFIRKWCWVILLIVVVLILVVILPIVFVAVPNIAQKELNKSQLELRSQIISNPQAGSVDLDIVTASLSNSSRHPYIDAFEADLFLENTLPHYKPFGRVTIPGLRANKETLTTINQTMHIVDMDQFINYCKTILGSETYRLALRGKVKLHEGAFPTAHLDFNKVIIAKGLNSLSGFHLSDINATLAPGPDGSNMHANALLPNPSLLTVDLGDVATDFYVDNILIGNATLANVVLKPGNNSIPLKAVANTTAILPLVLSKYQNGTIPIEVRGTSVSKNGVRLPYYEEALKSTPFHLPLDLAPVLASLGMPLNLLTAGGTGGSVPAVH